MIVGTYRSANDCRNRILCGRSVADVMWILAEYDDGFLEGKKELCPVVVLNLTGRDGKPMDIDVYENVKSGWKGFKRLLKFMFGESTGLFYRIKDPDRDSKLMKLGYLFEG